MKRRTRQPKRLASSRDDVGAGLQYSQLARQDLSSLTIGRSQQQHYIFLGIDHRLGPLQPKFEAFVFALQLNVLSRQQIGRRGLGLRFTEVSAP